MRAMKHGMPPYRALLAALISMVLSCGTALAGPPPGPPYGGQADTLTVLGRSLAAQHSDRINIKDAPFGAYGDTQSSNLLQVTIAAGSAALHVAAGAFTPTDVGKRVNVDGAGPLRSLGYLQSIPVTTPGVYTARPVITLSGTGNSAGVVPLPLMAVQSAVVATGGAGFPASASVTLTMSIGSGGTAAQITGTTNPSGVLVGPLTVSIAGSYQQGTATDALLATATQTPVSANNTPTTFPTISLVWGLGGVQVAGQGAGLPLTGVSAAITGSATLGAPVVGQVVTPLSGKILSVSSPTDLVLDTTATTGVINSQLGLTWGHDDAPAIAAAKAAADARFALGGAYPVLYAPAGNYLVSSPTPTFSHQAGSIIGDGPGRTTFKLDANLAGPLFSWSEDWIGGNVSPGPFPSGPTADLARFYYGPLARGFAVVGDLTALGEQDALVLYDRNDRVHFEDVTGWYLNGRMAYAGVSLNVPTQAYMREAHWLDVYCGHCGAPGIPVYEVSTLDTNGVGDSTNTNDFINLMAWAVNGPGLVVRGNAPATAKATTFLNFSGGRLEGGQPGVSADLVTLGDPVMSGGVTNINFIGTRIIDGAAGSSGLKLVAPSAASQPYGVTAVGLVLSPMIGKAISILAGRNLRVDVASLSSVDTGVTVASSAAVAQPVSLDGRGLERSWTWSVDPTSLGSVLVPMFRSGDPSNGVNSTVVSTLHDGSASGGQAATAGCIDLQLIRTAPGQTCLAQYGAILGGRLNTINAAGPGAVIPGGDSNYANGPNSLVSGSHASDLNLVGARAHSAGNFAVSGDSEIVDQPIHATLLGSTPVRLAANSTTGAAAANNTLNLPGAGGFYAFGRVTVAAYDPTNVNGCFWYVDGLAAKKGIGASTTALVGSPVVTVANCDSALALTASALTIVADTINGGISITATGKAGVNLHVVADGHFVAVQ